MKYIVTTPDVLENRNSEFTKHKDYGCQAILMNFGGGYNNDQMRAYKQMFITQQKAFVLKPNNLLRDRVVNSPPRSVNQGSVFSKYWCSGPVPGEYTLSTDVARQMGCVALTTGRVDADISGIVGDAPSYDISEVIINNPGNYYI